MILCFCRRPPNWVRSTTKPRAWFRGIGFKLTCATLSVDQKSYFALQYMVDGSVVTYATLKNGTLEFENNNVLYLGHTNIRPRDSVQRYRKSQMADILFYAFLTYL